MSVNTITPKELNDLLTEQPDLHLVDIRMPPEFREVHVAGASNIPFDRLSAQRLASAFEGNGGSTTYFICKAGKYSLKACEKARKLGLSEVVSVEGGTDACAIAGLSVERGKKGVSLERQVRITAGLVILAGAVLAMTVHPYWVGVPAFIGAGLVYSGISDTCGMAAMLTRMPWNRY